MDVERKTNEPHFRPDERPMIETTEEEEYITPYIRRMNKLNNIKFNKYYKKKNKKSDVYWGYNIPHQPYGDYDNYRRYPQQMIDGGFNPALILGAINTIPTVIEGVKGVAKGISWLVNKIKGKGISTPNFQGGAIYSPNYRGYGKVEKQYEKFAIERNLPSLQKLEKKLITQGSSKAVLQDMRNEFIDITKNFLKNKFDINDKEKNKEIAAMLVSNVLPKGYVGNGRPKNNKSNANIDDVMRSHIKRLIKYSFNKDFDVDNEKNKKFLELAKPQINNQIEQYTTGEGKVKDFFKKVKHGKFFKTIKKIAKTAFKDVLPKVLKTAKNPAVSAAIDKVIDSVAIDPATSMMIKQGKNAAVDIGNTLYGQGNRHVIYPPEHRYERKPRRYYMATQNNERLRRGRVSMSSDSDSESEISYRGGDYSLNSGRHPKYDDPDYDLKKKNKISEWGISLKFL